MNQKSNRLMYDRNHRKRSAKNAKKPGLGLGALALYLLLTLLSAGDGRVIAGIVLILAVAGLVWAGVRFGKKYVAGRSVKELGDLLSGKEKEKEAENYCKTCSDEFVYNNRQTEYNEQGQEESLNRDQQRRIRQLDHFLKNGLIDRQEYQVLLSHYEKRIQ